MEENEEIEQLVLSKSKQRRLRRKLKSEVMSGRSQDENTRPTAEKTREQIMAEREAKKRAKQESKNKKKSTVDPPQNDSLKKESKESQPTVSPQSNTAPDPKRTQVLAERELKKIGKKEVNQTLPELQNKQNDTGKTKAELKAERRAKQEAQRAAKKLELEKCPKAKEPVTAPKVVKVTLTKVEPRPKLVEPKTKKPSTAQKPSLFSHLELGQKVPLTDVITANTHPSVVELGAKYKARIISGSNARCIALLKTLKLVITDYVTPLEKEFSRGLESTLNSVMAYLSHCRPPSVSMTNSLRHVKSHLTLLPSTMPESEARRKLCDVIDTFIREQIDVAGEAICNAVQKKISDGDVIITYACSSIVYRILCESHRTGKHFEVLVTDGGPWYEGREMLRRLTSVGVSASYLRLSGLPSVITSTAKVLLGAHALLANGSVMSRSGSAMLALLAKSYNIPVLVCCETYKFCERVQTDPFVFNELAGAAELLESDPRLATRTDPSLKCPLTPLSLSYDVTPPTLVDAVVTEIAILPCTSVPVILRVKPSDLPSSALQ